MNVIVFGATGLAGRGIVEECANAGYDVTAYTRRDNYPFESTDIRIFKGDLTNTDDLTAALTDQQTIVCALGARDYSKPNYVISDWLERVIPIARKLNILRYLMVSGAGLLQFDEDILVRELPTYPPRFVNVNRDHTRALDLLLTSHLNWTLVCCPRIIEGDADGNYVVARDYVPKDGAHHITAGNIGRFMVQEIEAYPHTRVGIASKA